MEPQFFPYYSQQAEQLYERLKQNLFASGVSPFARRLIVVPSPAMKSWLSFRMAKDPHLGISAGIEFTYLDSAVDKLCNSYVSLSPKAISLSALEIAFSLEGEIRRVIAHWPHLPPDEQASWKPLITYLRVDCAKPLLKRSERRLTLLCMHLADLFRRYSVYGGNVVSEWTGQEGWQQQLWWNLFIRSGNPYLHQSLSTLIQQTNLKPKLSNIHIHLFALSFLSELHHNFFLRIAADYPVHLYFVSPCQNFWNDLLTSKERAFLISKQEAVEEYLQEGNLLLSNWGRLGRKMAMQIEDHSSQIQEDYPLPSAVTETENILQSLQADLVLYPARNPHSSRRFQNNDSSLQIHAVSTRLREVQVLYDVLLELIYQDNSITPGEIVVMAPNIMDYAPYISMVFEAGDSLLKIQLFDSERRNHNPLIQGMNLLFALSSGRWEASAVLSLLEHPAFQKKQHFKADEIFYIKEWIASEDIRWGIDLEHRNQALAKEHCRLGINEGNTVGTWEHAFKRLLRGIPIEGPVDQTREVLLGRWIYLMRCLWDDLQFFQNPIEHSLKDWLQRIKSLCECYFDTDNADAQEEWNSLLETLERAGAIAGSTTYSFTSVKTHLQALWNQPQQGYPESQLDRVSFCSMLPMRAIPAKVIVLMGMEDGAYPRIEKTSSLNLIHNNSKASYMPSQTDYDRFLFLEAILSARQHFVITYREDPESDGHAQPPALIVGELLAYINKEYVCEGDVVIKHPPHPFEKQYFLPNSRIKSYSKHYYEAAKALLESAQNESKSNNPFVPKVSCSVQHKTIQLDLRDLTSFARNPLKTYFNKTLGIYLNHTEDRIRKDEEDFQLSALQHYLFQQQALSQPVEAILSHLHAQNQLVGGPFKQIALDKLKDQLELRQQSLLSLGVQPQSTVEIVLCGDVTSPIQESTRRWKVPFLSISTSFGEVLLKGIISNVAMGGLLHPIKDEKSDLVKGWPAFLVFGYATQAYALPYSTQLLVLKGGKGEAKPACFSDPLAPLRDYIEYYLKSLQRLSPLLPEWIPTFMEGQKEDFSTELHDALHHPFRPTQNLYLQWALQKGAFPEIELLWAQGKQESEQLFGQMFQHWYWCKNYVI